jgi:hypothetical protein
LKAAIHNYIQNKNSDPKAFIRYKTAGQIRASTGRFRIDTRGSRH